MLRRSPKNRLLAYKYLVKVAELRKTIILVQNLDIDYRIPTEKISLSANKDALVAIKARNRSGR